MEQNYSLGVMELYVFGPCFNFFVINLNETLKPNVKIVESFPENIKILKGLKTFSIKKIPHLFYNVRFSTQKTMTKL